MLTRSQTLMSSTPPFFQKTNHLSSNSSTLLPDIKDSNKCLSPPLLQKEPVTPYITRSVKRKLEETDKKNIPFEFILDQILEKNSYINIDFEESSRAWNKNKKRMGNGSYIYK